MNRSAMRHTILAAVLGLTSFTLVACSGGTTPEVTPAPASPTPDATTDAAPTSAAEPSAAEPATSTGTREAPLAIGEARKLSPASAWTVALQASNLDATDAILAADEYAPRPADGEAFIVGTFAITVDGGALAAQGVDVANAGVQPWQSLTFQYVAADGSTSFDPFAGTMCSTGSDLYSQGSVFQDGAVVTGDVCIALPGDKVQGGLWRVSNSINDSVWIASN